MSTSSFPSSGDSSPHPELLLELSSMSETVTRLVQEVEPKARELNRHLTAVLGRCASHPDGHWVSIAHTPDGGVHLQLSAVDTASALVLVARLAEISEVLEDNAPHVLSSRTYESDLGPLVVGDAAALRNVPSTHLRGVQ